MAVIAKDAAADVRIPTKEKFARAKKHGSELLRKLAPELKALNLGPEGYVIIDIETGVYVTGARPSLASQKWRELPSRTIGWGSRIEDLE